jgi:hypothetical protein
MSNPGLFAIALLLSILAGLSFLAGSPTMELLPRSYANFGGIALGGLAAVSWITLGIIRKHRA